MALHFISHPHTNTFTQEMEKLTMSLVLFFVLIAISTIHGHEDPKEIEEWFLKVRHHSEKVTRLHFYFHDIPHGKNVTSATVAQSGITDDAHHYFGEVSMMDYPLTLEPSLNSGLVARGQGMYAGASMYSFDLFMALNIVFSSGEYNGSSIAVFGHNPTRRAAREMAIVGGTGVFRLARGVVILKTHKYDLVSGNATVGVDVVAIHHQSMVSIFNPFFACSAFIYESVWLGYGNFHLL